MPSSKDLENIVATWSRTDFGVLLQETHDVPQSTNGAVSVIQLVWQCLRPRLCAGTSHTRTRRREHRCDPCAVS